MQVGAVSLTCSEHIGQRLGSCRQTLEGTDYQVTLRLFREEMLFALWMHVPKRENMVLTAAGAHLHTQQASRLTSKGRQKSVQDLGLQETADRKSVV